MARSLLHLKAAAAGALCRVGRDGFGFGSNLGIAMSVRRYTLVAAKVEWSEGFIRAEPKQADDKASASYRQRSWMPDPVTGYYVPEPDIAKQTQTSRPVPN